MERIDELRQLLQERSIRKGRPREFRLASGDVSSYYCNTKTTTLSPRGGLLVGEVLWPVIAAMGVEAVGGLAVGAAFVSTPIVLASAMYGDAGLYGFAVRQERKEHGLTESVVESFHPDGRPLLSPGRRVAVVDDVVTRGGSVIKAIRKVRELGCDIAAVVALVDRRAGGREAIAAESLPYFSVFYTDEAGDLHVDPEFRRLAESAAGPARARA